MVHSGNNSDWILVPATAMEIEALRKKCRRLVTRRAAFSAGAAAAPIPGIDIATDITLLVRLIEEINREFGLSPQQIDRLQPQTRIVVYRVVVGVGGVLVGRLVTRELVARMLQRAGMKIMLRYTARLVPVAGQVASAALGFAAFQAIGNQHIAACARVAEELLNVQAEVVS